MLPHEVDVTAGIATSYRVQLAAMAALHAAVVSMMTAGSWKVSKSRGLPPPVAQTMMGLLVKAKELFYVAPDEALMALDTSVGPEFRAGPAKPLLKFPPSHFSRSTTDSRRSVISRRLSLRRRNRVQIGGSGAVPAACYCTVFDAAVSCTVTVMSTGVVQLLSSAMARTT